MDYIRHFVDSDVFRPLANKTREEHPPDSDASEECTQENRPQDSQTGMVIGWIGNKRRIGKNYHTLYQPIAEAFAGDPDVLFVEATKENLVPVGEMPQIYNSLDLLLIASANDGGPAPAMEAYSCGVPVLSTNVGYVKTVAHDEAKSLILDSDDPKDFIDKIRMLQNDRSQLRRLKDASRRNILERWTVEVTIGDWLASLFDIKDRKP